MENLSRLNVIEEQEKPIKTVETWSLVPKEDVVSRDGIVGTYLYYSGLGKSTTVLDYYKRKGKICVETRNTIYVLGEPNSAFVKTHPDTLVVLSLAPDREKNNESFVEKNKVSHFPIKELLQNWGLSRVVGSPEDIGVIGRQVTSIGGGVTSPIENYFVCDDGIVVKTANSFYQLGVPNLGFSLKNSKLMEELGLLKEGQ